MTTDQIFPTAIVAVVVILVVIGVVRALMRRRGANEDAFGAGGTSSVPIGATGVAKTALDPSGVVLVVGEQWTATSRGGGRIEPGTTVRVVGQEGLTLRVDVEPGTHPKQE